MKKLHQPTQYKVVRSNACRTAMQSMEGGAKVLIEGFGEALRAA